MVPWLLFFCCVIFTWCCKIVLFFYDGWTQWITEKEAKKAKKARQRQGVAQDKHQLRETIPKQTQEKSSIVKNQFIISLKISNLIDDGKGTHDAKLLLSLNIPMLRGIVAGGTQFDTKAKGLCDAGKLVRDDIVSDIVTPKINKNTQAKNVRSTFDV